MRILVYSKMFPRPGNDSFGSYVYEQVSELIKLGGEIKIVSPRIYIPKCFGILGGKFKKYALAGNQYLYGNLIVDSPPCIWTKEIGNSVPELKYGIYKYSMEKKLLEACRNFKPDILYSLDPLLDGRLCVEIGNRLKIPVILIEHSVPENYRNLVGNTCSIRIYAEVVKSAAYTVFVTNSQKRLFECMIGEKIKGTVIYNGFRQECVTSATKKKEKTFSFISVGFLEDRKGYPTVFKAIQLLKEKTKRKFRWVILGDGYERRRYEEMAKGLGLEENVEFKGIVSHKEVYAYLRESDLFVLPSYEEAFGIVYLEAMSCGIPVVGTEGEGISDLIENGKNGYLVPRNNASALYRIMRHVMDCPEEAALVSQKGLETIQDMTWKKNAENMYQVFCRITEGNRNNGEDYKEDCP